MTRCSEQQALLGFRIEQVRHLLGEGEAQGASVGEAAALLFGRQALMRGGRGGKTC